MDNLMTIRRSILIGLLSGLGLFMDRAGAAPVQFTIDPAQTQITLSGSVAGSTLKEQGPGSLTTTISGTMLADVTGTSIQFTGGSSLIAKTNGVWQPGPGGASGSAPADYGAQASTFLGTIKGALRDLVLDMTSGSLPINNGQFDASGLIFGFKTNGTAAFDYDAGFLGRDSIELSGLSTNKIVNGATLSGASGSQKLVIQVDTEFKFSAISDNDSAVHLTGQLVAAEAAGGPRILSISVQNQNATVLVQGAAASTALQFSSDFKGWNALGAARADNANGAAFTFPLSGNQGFIRTTQ